jgi:hypothetical protein
MHPAVLDKQLCRNFENNPATHNMLSMECYSYAKPQEDSASSEIVEHFFNLPSPTPVTNLTT